MTRATSHRGAAGLTPKRKMNAFNQDKASAVRSHFFDGCGVVTYRNAFSRRECDAIVDHFRAVELFWARLGTRKESRRSLVGHLVEDAGNHWISSRLRSFLLRTNRYFDFDLAGLTNYIQYSEYAVGGHIDWHVDVAIEGGLARKVSLVVQLTDPIAYEGGRLEHFQVPDAAERASQGAVIVFPAHMPHRVTAVTFGCRRSLAAWALGPPFR